MLRRVWTNLWCRTACWITSARYGASRLTKLPELHLVRSHTIFDGADAIAAAARQIADTLDLSAIICWTSSGSTGLRVARERPQVAFVGGEEMD